MIDCDFIECPTFRIHVAVAHIQYVVQRHGVNWDNTAGKPAQISYTPGRISRLFGLKPGARDRDDIEVRRNVIQPCVIIKVNGTEERRLLTDSDDDAEALYKKISLVLKSIAVDY
jgi:hypothetical protein